MTTGDRAEQMVQNLRTLSLTYAAKHYDYIESLKGKDTDVVAKCRMEMVRAYKELDGASRALKAIVSKKNETVVPFPNLDRSWGKLASTLAKAAEDVDDAY